MAEEKVPVARFMKRPLPDEPEDSLQNYPVEVWSESLRAVASLLERQAAILRNKADSLEKRFSQKKVSLGVNLGG